MPETPVLLFMGVRLGAWSCEHRAKGFNPPMGYQPPALYKFQIGNKKKLEGHPLQRLRLANGGTPHPLRNRRR